VKRTIRIASRTSELALRQAKMVEDALTIRGYECEIVTFKTTGDKKIDEPLSEIGAKGLFTAELEKALVRKKVDCCVHSLKDLPTELPDGLMIGAVLPREDPRDVIVINSITEADTLDDLPAGSRVGTSSLRRRAQLLALRPDLEVVELRGNVPTRLRKVDTAQVHAAILAAAGLIRLDATQHISQYLDAPSLLPAAGQGAIAVEIREDDNEMRSVMDGLNDPETQKSVTAERAFLRGLEGGCQVPIGALAVRNSSGELQLHGFVSDTRGHETVRGSIVVDESDPSHSGEELAADLRTRGATSLLVEIRNSAPRIAPQPE